MQKNLNMDKIKQALKSKGLTYSDLASKLGVSEQSVKQTINRDSISTSTLERIAQAIDVPAWTLIADAPNAMAGTQVVCPHCGKPVTVELK